VVADGGDFIGTCAYTVNPRKPLRWLDPGAFGTLGVGAGFALAAKLLHPDAEIWLLYGDGAAGFSLVEFDTFVRRKLGIIAVIGNDGAWHQILRDQKRLLGSDLACVLSYQNYHKVAAGFGGHAILVSEDDQIDAALQEAKRVARTGTPVLVNCVMRESTFREGAISV